jgi:hypothetical protein
MFAMILTYFYPVVDKDVIQLQKNNKAIFADLVSPKNEACSPPK